MSIAGVILGTVLQGVLGLFLFMLVVFSPAVSGNGTLTESQTNWLNFSIYALPATCFVSAVIVFFLYLRGSGPASYWWYGLPVVAAVIFVVYALNVGSGT